MGLSHIRARSPYALRLFLLLLAGITVHARASDPTLVASNTVYAPYYGVDAENDVVYAASYGVADGNGLVHAFSLGGGSLTHLAQASVDGARKVKAVGSRVYVLYCYYLGGLWRSGLNIYDFTGSSFSSYDTGLYWTGKSLGFDVEGHRAYIPVEDDKLMIINVANPEEPAVEGNYGSVGAAYDVEVVVGIAYLSGGPDGLHVIDVSDPTETLYLGGFYPSGSASVRGALHVLAGLTYAVGEGMWCVDLGIPLLPDLKYAEFHDAVQLDLGDDRLHVAGDGGYTQFDITDPTNIVFTGRYITGAQANDVCYVSPFVYIADNTGLYVLQNNDAPPPGVDLVMTMHELEADAIQNLDEPLDLANEAVPLEPVLDPLVLAAQPDISAGLVADGVTPLLFKLTSTGVGSPVTSYWDCVVDDSGAGIDGGIYSNMHTLAGFSWDQADASQGSRRLDFNADETLHFVYLDSLQPWDVLLAPEHDELNMRFRLLEWGSGEPLLPDLRFRIRRPPLALLSYGVSNLWGGAFLAALHETRPHDFIRAFQDNWTDRLLLNYFSAFPKSEPWSDLLDWITTELPASGWALSRIDCIAHSSAGVAIGDLCKQGFSSGTTTFRDPENHQRGWFRRLVTLGSPHNGTRLLPYLDGLVAFGQDVAPELFMLIPESVLLPPPLRVGRKDAMAFMYFDPCSDFRQLVATDQDPAVKSHHVVTAIRPDPNPSFAYLGLTGDRLTTVFLSGSDAIVDTYSARRLVVLDHIPYHWYQSSHIDGAVSHCEPASIYGGDAAQVNSSNVAKRIVALLNDRDAEFREFNEPLPLSNATIGKINKAGFTAGLALLVEVLIDNGPSGSALTANAAASVTCSIDPPPEAPLSGDVTWVAEVYGQDGVTTVGLTVTPDPGDSTRVTVDIEESVVGDVVLFASYMTPGNNLVFARPIIIQSTVPAGSTVTGIEVAPDASSLSIGDTLRPEIFARYNDGSRWRRWLTSNDVTVISGDPAVVAVSNMATWQAIDAGSATVTVTHLGFDATCAIDVVDPFPSQTFDEWRAGYFTHEELTNAVVSGPQVDGEPDGWTLAQEYCFAGNPHLPEEQPPLRIEMTDVGGSLQPAVVCRVSTTVEGYEMRVRESQSLSDAVWRTFYDLAQDSSIVSPMVIDCRDGGYFMEMTLTATSPVPDYAFYQLQASNVVWITPPPASNVVRVTANDRNDTYPEWHPSQDLIVFITDRIPYPGAPNLGAVRADGSNERIMASGPNSGSYGLVRSLCWAGTAPNVFVEERLHNHEFLEFNVAYDGFRRTVTNYNDIAFTVRLGIVGGGLGICGSRDGSTVMWRRSSDGGTGDMSLRAASYTSLLGTPKRSATHGTQVVSVYHASDFLLNWGFALVPNGSKAVVARQSGTGRDLFLYNTDGTGTAVQLTDSGQREGALNEWPDVSPGGERIAFGHSESGEPSDIAVIDIDGDHFWNVTQTANLAESAPSWSPDGNQLAIMRYDTNESGALQPGEPPNWNIHILDLPD